MAGWNFTCVLEAPLRPASEAFFARADAKSVANNNDAHQQHQANNAAPRDLIISLRPLSDKMFVLRKRPAKAFGGALTGLTTTTHWSKSLWLKTDYRNSPPFASPQHHAL
jgi:hypothetical protein